MLVLFDVPNPPPEHPDYTQELTTPDWKAEADVINALKTLGHEVRLLGVHDDPGAIITEIKGHRPDVVFNLTEEFNRRSALDRDVPALLEMLDVRYTGNGPTGLTLCKNKGMAKEILSYHRIKYPDFAVFHPGAVERLSAKARLGRMTGIRDNMALVGILSTQLLLEQFIRYADYHS